jgi:hypothetical protein
MMNIETEFDQILIVEGKDDKHVIVALRKKYRIPENFDVIPCDGIDKLSNILKIVLKISEIKTIGVIIDADADCQSRWEKVKNILSANGFDLPPNLSKDGLIITNDSQRVGVWIMPDNNDKGMLEDFVAFLIPPEDKLIPVARSTLDDIESRQLNKYSMTHKSKALIHTWLAWQEEPGTPMGTSITKKYLSADDAECVKLFEQWLIRLFK